MPAPGLMARDTEGAAEGRRDGAGTGTTRRPGEGASEGRAVGAVGTAVGQREGAPGPVVGTGVDGLAVGAPAALGGVGASEGRAVGAVGTAVGRREGAPGRVVGTRVDGLAVGARAALGGVGTPDATLLLVGRGVLLIWVGPAEAGVTTVGAAVVPGTSEGTGVGAMMLIKAD